MKKFFSIVGILAGIALIIFGLVVTAGGLGNGLSYGSDSPYDSGYAAFGGDFYTYAVNNSAETASAARATAANMADIYGLLEACLGVLMMFFGITAVCGFGLVYAGCRAVKVQTPTNIELTEDAIEEKAEADPEETEDSTENE